MTMAHDLLEEPLLTWRDRRGNRAMTTLPGILQRLGSGEVGGFSADAGAPVRSVEHVPHATCGDRVAPCRWY